MNAASAPAPVLDLSGLRDSFAGQVLQRLQAMIDPLVLVGGSVRDLLLGRELHDLDVALSAGGLELARRLADALHGAYVPLDAERDTGRAVLVDPDGQPFYIDCAAWRGPSLADDLRLRDFTVNALAADVRGDAATVIDVTGGLADLEARLLRTTSAQALLDDPLRCLRGARLLAELSPWHFRLEQDTARQIGLYAFLIAACAAERARDELVRILAAPQPDCWLRTMGELGLLAVVLPEVEALRGVEQAAPHVYDVFDHTAQVLGHIAWLADWIGGLSEPSDAFDVAACDVLAAFRPALAVHLDERVGASIGRRRQALRWAALCHDWGKPASRAIEIDPDDGRQRTRFLGHEALSVDLTRDALHRLRFSEAELRWVTTIVAGHMRPHHLAATGQASRRAVYRYFRDLGPSGVDTCLLSLADLRATAGPHLSPADWRRQLDLVAHLLDAYFNRPLEAVRPAPLIDGHDLMTALQLTPGRQIGELLDAVAEAQAAGELESQEQALALAARLIETSKAGRED